MAREKYKMLHLTLLECITNEYELSKRIYDQIKDENYLSRMAVIDSILYNFQNKILDKNGKIDKTLIGGENEQ